MSVESGADAMPQLKRDETTPFPGRTASWYLVVILLVAYTLSFVDRTILALMVQPIQRDLGISDTEFSLLHGLAFAIFYTFLGIPIAALADRYSRRTLIAVGITMWSVATALCGLTRNYTELFLARMGVGIGEASLSPAAYSMIADSFPKEKLGRALGVYQVGVFMGAGLAYLIGGTIIDLTMKTSAVTLPIIGVTRTWQLVFIIVGLPGLLISLWIMTVREPARRHLQTATPAASGFADLFCFLAKHKRLFFFHFMGFSLAALVFNGFNAWAPAMYVRKFGLGQGEVGQLLGAILLVFGTGGIITGGWLADLLMRLGHSDGTLKSGLVGVVGMLPFAIAAPLVENWQVSIGLMALFFFFSSFLYAGGAASLQIVTPGPLRAQVSALYLFFINLLGIGLGPTAIALLTDTLFADKLMVDKSMGLVGGAISAIAALALYLSLAPFNARSDGQAFSTTKSRSSK